MVHGSVGSESVALRHQGGDATAVREGGASPWYAGGRYFARAEDAALWRRWLSQPTRRELRATPAREGR